MLNFLHRRGGFAKSWKFIAPANENTPPQTSSTTDGNLTMLTGEVGQLCAGSHFLFNARARFSHKGFWDTIWTRFGQLPDAPRTLLGRLPDAPRTPPGRSSDASRMLFGRLPESSQSRRCLLRLRCLLKLCVIRATSRGVNTYSSTNHID